MLIEYTQKIRNAEVKARRLALGLTQKELADKAGVSRLAIGIMERFGRVSQETVDKIAKYLGVDSKVVFPDWIKRIREIPTELVVEKDVEEAQFVSLAQRASQNLISQDKNPSEILEIKEEAEMVQQAMKCLTPHQREILGLRYGFGMSIDAIANRLNVGVSNVRCHVKNGLENLVRSIPLLNKSRSEVASLLEIGLAEYLDKSFDKLYEKVESSLADSGIDGR